MKTKKAHTLCLLVLGFTLTCSITLFGQLERHTWFFGGPTGNAPAPVQTGIRFDFDTNQPQQFNDVRYPLRLQENNIIISDPSTGAIQFYSDGQTVIDRSHQPMPNGENLAGSVSSMYGTTVVFDPDNCDRYYLFSVQSFNNQPPRRIYYSIIDMELEGNGSAANPLGDVTGVKNVDLTPTGANITEGLFALPKSGNTRESWLFFLNRNNGGELFIYDVTSGGVNFFAAYPLSDIMDGLPGPGMRSIKMAFRPVNDNLGQLILAPGFLEDESFPIGHVEFDKVAGTINTGTYVNIDSATEWVYGATFSPDYSKLYYSDYFKQTLSQYDFNTGNLEVVGESFHDIRSGGVELGPDGKVYWANIYSLGFGQEVVPYMSVVTNPNAAGDDCGLQYHSWSFGGAVEPRLVGALPTFGSFPDPPKALESQSEFCGQNDGAALLDPGGLNLPLDIQWDNGETGYEIINLAAGIYMVTVTESSGCEYILEVEVEAADSIFILPDEVFPSNPSNCLTPNDGFLTVVSDQLFPNTTYQVAYKYNGVLVPPTAITTNNQGILQILNLSPGEYSDLELTIPGFACEGFINHAWTISLPVVDAPDAFLVSGPCVGESLTLSASDFPGATYEWAGPNGFSAFTRSITISTSATLQMEGYYTVKMFLDNCESELDSIFVAFSGLSLDLGADLALCEEETTLVANEGFSAYLWSNGATDPETTVMGTSYYSVTATDDLGCEFADTIYVDLYGLLQVDLGDDQYFCEAETIDVLLDASGNTFTSYLWSNGSMDSAIIINTPGFYELSVTDAQGCTATDVVEIIQVTPLPLGLGADQILCDLESFELVANAGFDTYLWSTGESGRVKVVVAEGRYWVDAIDEFGCLTSDTIGIELYPQRFLSIEQYQEIDLGDSILLDVQVVPPADDLLISWTPAEGLSCDDCLTPYAKPFYTQEYQVRIEDEFACADSTRLTLRVNPNRNIFIPNAFSPNNDGVNDQLEIFTDNSVEEILSFRIFDRWGELVFERNNETTGWDGRLKEKPMNSGVFVYVANILFVDGRKEVYSGDILLVR